MSYIRSHSNPEGLYIFECGGKAHFMIEGDYKLVVPLNVFKTAMKRVKDRWGWANLVMYKDFVITETKDFKWKFKYKRRSLEVYETTLMYILTQNDWSGK